MTSSKAKNTAILLVGAVALATGAYGLGSQTGDGSAAAVTKATARSSATAARPAFRRGGFGGPGH
ncbi:MAG: hypothetical protein QOE28_2790, partial [Solirubrobacteraceae bacterium]|nr:hypothetical protein [Solirubrobacteraceae bacterium]